VFPAAGGGVNAVARCRDVACLVDERVGGLWSGSGQKLCQVDVVLQASVLAVLRLVTCCVNHVSTAHNGRAPSELSRKN